MGTYNLNGGLLTGGPDCNNNPAGVELIGVAGTGIFNQSGGTNVANADLFVGGVASGFGIANSIQLPSNPGFGRYNLNLGELSTEGGLEYVGGAGTGIFTQTGGTNLTSKLYLGGYSYLVPPPPSKTTSVTFVATPGTYNLNGGMFQASLIAPGTVTVSVSGKTNGPAILNLTAGTLQAAAGGLSISTLVKANTAANTLATVDPSQRQCRDLRLRQQP